MLRVLVDQGGRLPLCGYCCGNDGTIARAPAKIALKSRFNIRIGDVIARLPQGIKRHHNAGRAKPTLAGMQIHLCLLHRMQRAICFGNMFNVDNMAQIDRGQQPNTGIDGFIDHCRTRPAPA